jgi:hypothetical protein
MCAFFILVTMSSRICEIRSQMRGMSLTELYCESFIEDLIGYAEGIISRCPSLTSEKAVILGFVCPFYFYIDFSFVIFFVVVASESAPRTFDSCFGFFRAMGGGEIIFGPSKLCL